MSETCHAGCDCFCVDCENPKCDSCGNCSKGEMCISDFGVCDGFMPSEDWMKWYQWKQWLKVPATRFDYLDFGN